MISYRGQVLLSFSKELTKEPQTVPSAIRGEVEECVKCKYMTCKPRKKKMRSTPNIVNYQTFPHMGIPSRMVSELSHRPQWGQLNPAVTSQHAVMLWRMDVHQTNGGAICLSGAPFPNWIYDMSPPRHTLFSILFYVHWEAHNGLCWKGTRRAAHKQQVAQFTASHMVSIGRAFTYSSSAMLSVENSEKTSAPNCYASPLWLSHKLFVRFS